MKKNIKEEEVKTKPSNLARPSINITIPMLF
jgi:hypothetical protein